jgi:DNA-binding transcriptional regulator YiaG
MQFNRLTQTLELSRTKLAETLGVHYMTLQKWASGSRTPSAATLRFIKALVWLHNNHPETYSALIKALDNLELQSKEKS